jgi:hypothetical protein
LEVVSGRLLSWRISGVPLAAMEACQWL